MAGEQGTELRAVIFFFQVCPGLTVDPVWAPLLQGSPVGEKNQCLTLWFTWLCPIPGVPRAHVAENARGCLHAHSPRDSGPSHKGTCFSAGLQLTPKLQFDPVVLFLPPASVPYSSLCSLCLFLPLEPLLSYLGILSTELTYPPRYSCM